MGLKEGVVLNNIFYRKFVNENKNFLGAIVGPTGSGKSWFCLSVCDKWYKKFFKEPYPIENVGFSVEEIMEMVVKGNLREGEILIMEEAGTSMGSLDFQNKISKLFNYILQSFRSKNIGLLVNLPYFSMLNKQMRMLMHMTLQAWEINKAKQQSTFKPYHMQWNQQSGKCYRHRPKIMLEGVFENVDYIVYSAPPKELVDKYEKRKALFVEDLSKEVLNKIKLEKIKDEQIISNEPRLRGNQSKVKTLYKSGITESSKIAEILGLHQSHVCRNISKLREMDEIS